MPTCYTVHPSGQVEEAIMDEPAAMRWVEMRKATHPDCSLFIQDDLKQTGMHLTESQSHHYLERYRAQKKEQQGK